VERDVLIGRVVDGEATGADWAALEAAAQGDPGVWRDLALAQRDHAALAGAVGAAVGVAARVDLPIGGGSAGGGAPPAGRIGAWGGWAAAAAVALAWGGTAGPLRIGVEVPGGGGGAVQQAGLV